MRGYFGKLIDLTVISYSRKAAMRVFPHPKMREPSVVIANLNI